MIHGPCVSTNSSSTCIKNEIYTKRYPWSFLKDTQTDKGGYLLYRRRTPQEGGFTVNIKVRGLDVSVENTWFIPYCPILNSL